MRARDAQDVGRLLRGQHRAGRNQRDGTARCDTVQKIEHQVGDRGRQANGLTVFAVNGEDAIAAPRVGKRRYRPCCACNLVLRRKTVSRGPPRRYRCSCRTSSPAMFRGLDRGTRAFAKCNIENIRNKCNRQG